MENIANYNKLSECLSPPEQEVDTSDFLNCDTDTANLRSRLIWFRSSPIQKFRCRKRYIIKLILQAIKILCITLQAVLFIISNSNFHSLVKNTKQLSAKLFLQNSEDNPIPLIYTRQNMAEYIEFAYQNYQFVMKDSIMNISKFDNSGFNICHKLSDFFIYSKYDDIESEFLKTECFSPQNLTHLRQFTSNLILFKSISRFSLLVFNFKFRMRRNINVQQSDCYKSYVVSVNVDFKNEASDGILRPSLSAVVLQEEWGGKKQLLYNRFTSNAKEFFFNLSFAIISIFSLILSVRSFISCIILLKRCKLYFKERLNYCLSFSEQIEFYNIWFIIYTITDILSLISCLIFMLEILKGDMPQFVLNFVIGINCLLIWIGLLRYFKYLKSFDFLLVIIRLSAGTSIRFILCAATLFIGFSLCAYTTIGPYHYKLYSFSRVLETMFSLMNGDEIYTTYQNIQKESTMMIIFSKIFFSITIFFFTYIVISTFIAILNDFRSRLSNASNKDVITSFICQCNCSRCTLYHNRHPIL